jgi:hypothetical protein
MWGFEEDMERSERGRDVLRRGPENIVLCMFRIPFIRLCLCRNGIVFPF